MSRLILRFCGVIVLLAVLVIKTDSAYLKDYVPWATLLPNQSYAYKVKTEAVAQIEDHEHNILMTAIGLTLIGFCLRRRHHYLARTSWLPIGSHESLTPNRY